MKNKLCCRIYPIVLLLIAALISAGLWYFDEGVHEFRFLIERKELIPFLGSVLFVALIPIGLFYYLNDNEKYQTKARLLALLGFLPALLLLIILIQQGVLS